MIIAKPQPFLLNHEQQKKSDVPAQWAKYYFSISHIGHVKYEFPPK